MTSCAVCGTSSTRSTSTFSLCSPSRPTTESTVKRPVNCSSAVQSATTLCECCERLGQCCVSAAVNCFSCGGVCCESHSIVNNNMDTRTDTPRCSSVSNNVRSNSSSTTPRSTCACGQESRNSWRTRSRTRQPVGYLWLVAFLAVVTSADACSTRSTPKARSTYVSQLHQQQYPRPTPHFPLLPRHPSPIRETAPASQPSARAPLPPQAPSVPTVSDADLTTQRPNVTFQTYPCPEAYAKWYCLNGAQCFSVKIGESVLYNCECADGYMGQRCEFKDLDGTYLHRRGVLIETASIASSVLIIILVVTICCMLLYLATARFDRTQQQFHIKSGQYVYRNCNAVLTTKQAVPVAVLTTDALVRTV